MFDYACSLLITNKLLVIGYYINVKLINIYTTEYNNNRLIGT